MRLPRGSLRMFGGTWVRVVSALMALSFAAACGGGGSAAPTATVVPASPSVAVPAPSPQRPALASPVASPSTASPSASPTVTAADTAGDTYEVQSGDTLATIAEQFYSDSTLWRRIYDANKDTIGADPDKLKLGMQLKIPPKQ